MDKPNVSTHKKQHIEKLTTKFSKIDGGCTSFINRTIQNIRDPILLAFYTYLASQHPEWKISAKQLSNHFNLGINKTRRCLTLLVKMGLIIRIEIKEKGKFIEYEHNLLIKPLTGYGEAVPLTGNRETKTVKRRPCTNKEITSLQINNIKKDANATSTPKTQKPTQMDKQEFAAGVKGYEWVGECLKSQ